MDQLSAVARHGSTSVYDFGPRQHAPLDTLNSIGSALVDDARPAPPTAHNPSNIVQAVIRNPTWDGAKTTLSAFNDDLKAYFRRDATAWTFILYGYVPTPSGKLILAHTDQAKIIDGTLAAPMCYTYEAPAPVLRHATAGSTPSKRSGKPDATETYTIDTNKYIVNPALIAHKDLGILGTIVTFIDDPTLAESLFESAHGSGRNLISTLRDDAARALRPEHIVQLTSYLDVITNRGTSALTRLAFNEFKRSFDRALAALPPSNRPPDAMISERYKAAVIRGDLDTARRLGNHFTINRTDMTNSADVADAIRDFLDAEEALTVYARAASGIGHALVSRLAPRNQRPDPRKHPPAKPPTPCHHCGGDHYNRACDSPDAGTYKFKQTHPDKFSAPAEPAAPTTEHDEQVLSLLAQAFDQPPGCPPPTDPS